MNQQEETVPALWIVNGKSFDIRQRSEAEKLMQLATLGARVLEILRSFTDERAFWKSTQHSPNPCAIEIKSAARALGLLGEEAPRG